MLLLLKKKKKITSDMHYELYIQAKSFKAFKFLNGGQHFYTLSGIVHLSLMGVVLVSLWPLEITTAFIVSLRDFKGRLLGSQMCL